MSRVGELIQTLCPEGVQFESLGKFVHRSSSIRWSEVDAQEFQYIDLTSVDRITHTIGDTATITSEGAPSRAQQIVRTGDVLFGTTRPMLKRYCVVPAEYDGQIASTGYCVLRPIQDRLLTSFLYHLIGTEDFYAFIEANERGASYPAIPDRVVKEYRIPIPPLEVQREIVRILDQFTQLEAELEAELEARRRQFGFYRTALMTPDDSWRWMTIGSVAEVFDGPHATPKKVDVGPWYLSISSLVDGRVDLSSSARLASSDLAQWTKRVAPRRGDTLFSYETRIGQAGHWDSDEPAALGRRMGLLRPRSGAVDPRFLTYAYLGPQFGRQIEANTVSGSTVDRIPIAKIANWPLALPSLDKQTEVVGILEQFDELSNGFSVGLPAELAARRQQYEYYRDRLLTFKEASA